MHPVAEWNTERNPGVFHIGMKSKYAVEARLEFGCNDGHYYTGSTKDLDLRLAEHNRGVGCNFTS